MRNCTFDCWSKFEQLNIAQWKVSNIFCLSREGRYCWVYWVLKTRWENSENFPLTSKLLESSHRCFRSEERLLHFYPCDSIIPVALNRKAIRRLLSTNRENESATVLRTGLWLCMELCQAACTVNAAKLFGRHNKRVRWYPRCVSRPTSRNDRTKMNSRKSNRDRWLREHGDSFNKTQWNSGNIFAVLRS